MTGGSVVLIKLLLTSVSSFLFESYADFAYGNVFLELNMFPLSLILLNYALFFNGYEKHN